MRALVTGGHGFVGSHLVERLLADGTAVRCLLRRPGLPAALRDRPVELARGDVRGARAVSAAMEGVDEVFHLAALTRSRTRREMQRTNLGGTLCLLAAAAERRLPGRFVF
ncbi:MAG: NAD-dependent epimerase/dehydratase family protein, partial [Planctomycetota bacterium]